MQVNRFEIGEYKATLIRTGTFKLDAGIVFGAIPKALWGKYEKTDEYNRITLGINALFLDNGDRRILIDTGPGHINKYNEKLIEIWGLETTRIDDALGLDRNDVDIVVFTHLHFDHAGGATINPNGEYEPIFPNARYYAHEKEIEIALNPHALSRFSYFGRDYEPLLKKKILYALKGQKGSIEEDLSFYHTRGHTEGHIVVKVESDGDALYYLGDLVLTSLHLQPTWVSGIDLCRLESFYARETLYREALDKRAIFVFPHDKNLTVGRLTLDEKQRYKLISL